jgi:hypothetical protein
MIATLLKHTSSGTIGIKDLPSVFLKMEVKRQQLRLPSSRERGIFRPQKEAVDESFFGIDQVGLVKDTEIYSPSPLH